MKFDIQYFARLARINLSSEEEVKLGGDLKEILGHVEELMEVETENVAPMTGGTSLMNVTREDDPREGARGKGKDQFPETENGFLSVPKVFE